MVSSKADRAARAYAWRVLSVTSLGSILSAVNISALNVALPVVVRHFRAGATGASWLLLAYSVTTTVTMLSFGRLADLIGRRGLYVAGIAGLTLASLACGLAPSLPVLQVFRVAQAICAAALITNTAAIITDAFPRELLPAGLSIQLTLVAASQVAGPALGGVLAEHLGWRAVFWFNVPGGLIGTFWALVVLRRIPRPTSQESFDWVSAALTLLVLGGLVTGLSEVSTAGWTAPLVLVSFIAFGAALPLFVLRQRRAASPLVDMALFDSWARAAAYLTNFLLAAIRLGAVLLTGLYLQAAGSTSTGTAGLVVSCVAAGIVVTSPVAGWLVVGVGPQVVCTAGAALSAVALAILGWRLQPGTPPAIVAAVLLAIGVGAGLFMTPNTTAIMTSVPARRRGIANAVRSMSQNTGYALGTAVLLGIATAPLPAADKRAAYRGELSHLGDRAVARFTTSTHAAFWVLGGLAVLAVGISGTRGPAPIGPAPRTTPER